MWCGLRGSVIFVLIYFLVLVLVFQLFFSFTFTLVFIIFRFSFSFSFANYLSVCKSYAASTPNIKPADEDVLMI